MRVLGVPFRAPVEEKGGVNEPSHKQKSVDTPTGLLHTTTGHHFSGCGAETHRLASSKKYVLGVPVSSPLIKEDPGVSPDLNTLGEEAAVHSPAESGGPYVKPEDAIFQNDTRNLKDLPAFPPGFDTSGLQLEGTNPLVKATGEENVVTEPAITLSSSIFGIPVTKACCVPSEVTLPTGRVKRQTLTSAGTVNLAEMTFATGLGHSKVLHLPEHNSNDFVATVTLGLPTEFRVEEQIHEMTQCDGCHMYPLIGRCFRNLDTKQIDFCSACHDLLHEFPEFASKKFEEVFAPITDSGAVLNLLPVALELPTIRDVVIKHIAECDRAVAKKLAQLHYETFGGCSEELRESEITCIHAGGVQPPDFRPTCFVAFHQNDVVGSLRLGCQPGKDLASGRCPSFTLLVSQGFWDSGISDRLWRRADAPSIGIALEVFRIKQAHMTGQTKGTKIGVCSVHACHIFDVEG